MDRKKLYEEYLRQCQKLDCKEFVNMEVDWCDNYYIAYLDTEGERKSTSFYHPAFVDWLFDSYIDTMEVIDGQ